MASLPEEGVLAKEMILALTVQPVRRNRVVATMTVPSVVSGIKIIRVLVVAQIRVSRVRSVMVSVLSVVNGPWNVRHVDRNQESLATESRARPVPSPAVLQVQSNRNRSVTGLRRQNGKR